MKHNLWNLVANIKNGYVAKKLEIEVRRNKSCENLLNLLWNEGYISGFKIKTNDSYMINVFLKYNSEGTPALKSIKSVSKPSKRVFLTTKQLWKIDSSRTNAVFSTTHGFLTLAECKKKNVGGIVLFVLL